jgi:hypothetical protein
VINLAQPFGQDKLMMGFHTPYRAVRRRLASLVRASFGILLSVQRCAGLVNDWHGQLQ